MLSWESSSSSSMRMPLRRRVSMTAQFPEGAFFLAVDVHDCAGAGVAQPHVCPAVVAFAAGVGGAEHADPGLAAGGESLAGCGCLARLE
jgi:hypothetical protein